MILAIFRLVITALAFIVECVAKTVSCILTVLLTVGIIVLFPLLKRYWNHNKLYNYSLNWKYFPLTHKVYELWSW